MLDVAVMPLLKLPDFSDQAVAVKLAVAEASTLAEAAMALRCADLVDFVRKEILFPQLRHELSDLVDRVSFSDNTPRRTEGEFQLFRTVRQRQDGVGNRRVDFGILIDIARDTFEGIGLRDYRSRSVPASGYLTLFPDPSSIWGRLNELEVWLDRQYKLGTPAAFQALVAMAVFAGLHPLTDGNGRVSRVLFNLIINRRNCSLDHYFPLHDLSMRSDFGFIISLKLAQYGNEWQSLCEFLIQSLRIILGNSQLISFSRMKSGREGGRYA